VYSFKSTYGIGAKLYGAKSSLCSEAIHDAMKRLIPRLLTIDTSVFVTFDIQQATRRSTLLKEDDFP